MNKFRLILLLCFGASSLFGMEERALVASSDYQSSDHSHQSMHANYDVNDMAHHDYQVDQRYDFNTPSYAHFEPVFVFHNTSEVDQYDVRNAGPMTVEDVESSIYTDHRVWDAAEDWMNSGQSSYYSLGLHNQGSGVPQVYFNPERSGHVVDNNFHNLVAAIEENSWLNEQLQTFNAAELVVLGEIVKDGSIEGVLSLENLSIQFDYYYPNQDYSVGGQTRFNLGEVINQPLRATVKHIRSIVFDENGTIQKLNDQQKQEVAWVIARYIQFKYPNDFEKILQGYVDDGIKEFEAVLKIEQKEGVGGAICRWWHHKVGHRKPSVDLKYRIKNSPVTIALEEVRSLYLNGRYEEAESRFHNLCNEMAEHVEVVEAIEQFWRELCEHDPEQFQEEVLVVQDNHTAYMQEPRVETGQQLVNPIYHSLQPFVYNGESYTLKMSARELLYELKKDEKEFINFQGSKDQCQKNILLMEIINQASDKLSGAKTERQQAFLVGVVETAWIAHRCNKTNNMHNFELIVNSIVNESNEIVDRRHLFLQKTALRFIDNIKHPLNFIGRTAVGIGHLALNTVKALVFLDRNDQWTILKKEIEYVGKFLELTMHLSNLPSDEFSTIAADVFGDIITLDVFGGTASAAIRALKGGASLPALPAGAQASKITLEEALAIFEEASKEAETVAALVRAEEAGNVGLKFLANAFKNVQTATEGIQTSLPNVFSRFAVNEGKVARFVNQIKVLGTASQALRVRCSDFFDSAMEVAEAKLQEWGDQFAPSPELELAGGWKVPDATKDRLAEFMEGSGRDVPVSNPDKSIRQSKIELDKINKLAEQPIDSKKVVLDFNEKLNGSCIKDFKIRQHMFDHAFSADHIKKGLLKVAGDEISFMEKVGEKILEMECQGLTELGSNQIWSNINDADVTIRFFVLNGEVIKVNVFLGHTARQLGKTVRL